MADGDVVEIGAAAPLPVSELDFRFTRSGGPGGQHVNTSSTRAELTFDLAGSPTLTDQERERAMRRLRSRLDGEGRLRVVAQDERSQGRNRSLALRRFAELMQRALAPPPPPRRPTRRRDQPQVAAVHECNLVFVDIGKAHQPAFRQ